MSHTLDRWGRFAARHPWRTIGAWVLLTVVVVTSAATFGRDLERGSNPAGMDSQVAADLLAGAGLDEGGMTADVVASPAGGATFDDSPAARAELADLRDAILSTGSVLGASDPLARDGAGVSPDGRVALVGVQYPDLRELSAADLEELTATVDEVRASTSALQIEVGGALAWEFGESSSGTTELIGLGVAAVILLLAFGSLLAAGVPLLSAIVGLTIGVTGLGLVTRVVEIPDFAPALAAMVGLGVGIDYALFLTTRFREGLATGLDVPTAAGRAVATAGAAVIVAGGTVVVSILGLAVAGLPFLTAAGIAISVVVLVMVTASVTLVPAVMGLAGHRLLGRRGRRAPGRPGRGLPSARWHRWGAHVARRRWPWALGAAVLLLAMAAPVLAMRLGTPDLGTHPAESTERQAYDLVVDGYGPGATGPMLVVVDTAGNPAAVDDATAAVSGDPGVASVSPARVDAASGVASFAALPVDAPNDPEARETVLRLRSEVLPAALDGGPATAHVGGQTAVLADLSDRVEERLGWFILAVVLLSLIPLTVLFRSVVLPIKAAVMNLLSIGAAYGVLVMVFQWGWGASLIGVDAPVPIISFIPLMMFAVLFGLSMDYEVFLLSRVREAWLRTGDADAAVVEGLAATGRTITAAAAIMVAVFTGFALAPDPTVTMLGLGMATAIAVDATIVRLVLVPATMRILGRANWWLPAWLDRVLPRLDATEAATASPAAGPPVPVPDTPAPVLAGRS